MNKRDALLRTLAGYGSCAVAFSGGVDSAVVAKAAQLALGDAAVLVTIEVFDVIAHEHSPPSSGDHRAAASPRRGRSVMSSHC